MRITFTDNNRLYVIDRPKEIMQKVPTKKHRFKRGSGTCSFTPDEYYDFQHNKTHLLFIDMDLKQALLFRKEDILPTVTKRPYMAGFIFVAELMPLYLNKQYVVLGAANG